MTREVCEHQVPIFEHCNQCETRIYPKGQRVHLSKHELLQLLRLLSALESVMVYQSTSKALLPAGAGDSEMTNLRTAAQQALEALTSRDGDGWTRRFARMDEDGLPNSHLEFARAVERAHGIT